MLKFPLEVTKKGWTRTVDREELYGALGASHRRRLQVSLIRQIGRVFHDQPFFKRYATGTLVTIPTFEISSTLTIPNGVPLDISPLGEALKTLTKDQIRQETEHLLRMAYAVSASEGGPKHLDAGPILEDVFSAFNTEGIRAKTVIMNPITYSRLRGYERGDEEYVPECNRLVLKSGFMGCYKGMYVMQTRFVPRDEIIAFGERTAQDERDNPDVLDLVLTEKVPGNIELTVDGDNLVVKATEEVGMAIGFGFSKVFAIEDTTTR